MTEEKMKKLIKKGITLEEIKGLMLPQAPIPKDYIGNKKMELI